MDSLSLWRGEAMKTGRRDYVSLFNDLKGEIVAHCDEHISGIQLRKFAAWFSTGYAGAAQFRKNLFQSKSNEEIMCLADEFFAGIGNVEQEDTSTEEFLMGGHG
jgi:tRNA-dihydrouridine synthase